jgi:hypothetical protein
VGHGITKPFLNSAAIFEDVAVLVATPGFDVSAYWLGAPDGVPVPIESDPSLDGGAIDVRQLAGEAWLLMMDGLTRLQRRPSLDGLGPPRVEVAAQVEVSDLVGFANRVVEVADDGVEAWMEGSVVDPAGASRVASIGGGSPASNRPATPASWSCATQHRRTDRRSTCPTWPARWAPDRPSAWRMARAQRTPVDLRLALPETTGALRTAVPMSVLPATDDPAVPAVRTEPFDGSRTTATSTITAATVHARVDLSETTLPTRPSPAVDVGALRALD